jgi:hypothetical protein
MSVIAFEKSKGKVRPALPRASDLGQGEAAGKPTEGRADGGRFAAGNAIGLGARWKASVKKALGPHAVAGAVEVIRGDAERIYLAVLRSVGSDAAPVRALAALHARHMALHAFYTRLAEEKGLDTDEGQKVQALADGQSVRAERTVVSCIAAARALATTPKTITVAKLHEAMKEAAKPRRTTP